MGLLKEKKGIDRNPSSLKKLDAITRKKWSKTPLSVCSDLVRNDQKLLKAIIDNKG